MKGAFLLCLCSFCFNYTRAQLGDNLKIDSTFEKFDLIAYNDLIRESPNYPAKFLPNGTYIEMIKANSGATCYETPPDSYFQILKDFYPNGNIHKKGLNFNVSDGFKKGTWYEFDEQGKLTKEIDYDKPYKFTFEDVLNFCAKEGIRVDIGPILQSTGFHTLIRRENSIIFDDTCWWEIKWLKKPDLIETIKLNGITGQVINKKEMKYINN